MTSATPSPSPVFSLALLDDAAWVFDTFTDPLATVLGAEVHPMLHDRQTIDHLVGAVQSINPHILLLDGNLANGIEGPDLLRNLIRASPAIRCIGFSRDPAYAPAFRAAGAIGFVQKKPTDPLGTARTVAAVIRGQTA
jgi:hypothetical protein